MPDDDPAHTAPSAWADASRLREDLQVSSALARIGRELIALLDTPEILTRLAELTREVLDSAVSGTVVWVAAEDDFALITGMPGVDGAVTPLRIPAEAVTTVLQLLDDRGCAEYAVPAVDEPVIDALFRHYGIGRALCVPLRRGDTVTGLHLAGRRSAAELFTDADRRIAEGVGHLASLALANAFLLEETDRLSRLKSEFVSTMSHELRTPIAVIIGYVDMLRDDPTPSGLRFGLARMRHAAVELLDLVQTTLDMSRLQSGHDVPQVELLAVRPLLRDLAGTLADLPRRAEVALVWHEPADVWLVTDRRKLTTILRNLVTNALKFTHAGRVEVRCIADGEHCHFSVRDTGIGIGAEHLSTIFEMFRQVDGSDARAYGGVGLGLYIVQALGKQLGGTVAVESELGLGSHFRVTLPLVPAAGWSGASPAAGPPEGARGASLEGGTAAPAAGCPGGSHGGPVSPYGRSPGM